MSDPSKEQRVPYCKCAFTDPDGTFVPGEACQIHPDVTPRREAPSSNERLTKVIARVDRDSAAQYGLNPSERTLMIDGREWEWIKEAVSANETNGSDAQDAAKWRALRNCARITAIGSAGMERPNDPDAHVTLNFWTHNERETEPHPRQWLDTFVKKAMALGSPAEMSESPLGRAVRIARGDVGPPTEPVRFSEKASEPHEHVWKQNPSCGDLAICDCGDPADGWYCPKSPDHLCHYVKGNCDSCDYCGQPEERK